jgi:hypothetical protein
VNRLILVCATCLAFGSADAALPVFAAKCGAGLNVDTNPKGEVHISGRLAKTTKRPDGQISANADGAWVDITPRGSEPPRVTYTAKDRSTGTCDILGLAAPGGAKASAAPDRPSHSEHAGQGKFDANGPVRCSRSASGPLGECKAEVARDPGGNASIKVTHGDGRMRFIFFEKGKALSADLSQADSDMTFGATKESDLYKIRAGRERYEIPEMFVFGG